MDTLCPCFSVGRDSGERPDHGTIFGGIFNCPSFFCLFGSRWVPTSFSLPPKRVGRVWFCRSLEAPLLLLLFCFRTLQFIRHLATTWRAGNAPFHFPCITSVVVSQGAVGRQIFWFPLLQPPRLAAASIVSSCPVNVFRLCVCVCPFLALPLLLQALSLLASTGFTSHPASHHVDLTLLHSLHSSRAFFRCRS